MNEELLLNDTALQSLSEKEIKVLTQLVNAFNFWVTLESLHPDETDDFRRAIHAAQHIVMSRPIRRQVKNAREKSNKY